MGDYLGELPRKFISFHCLEIESNELKNSNTEGTENFPDLPRTSELEIVVIKATENSLAKSLATLQVATARESTSRESEDTNEDCFINVSQECLLLSSDEVKEGLKKFLRDKRDSVSGEGLERFVEADPIAVLELLTESLMERRNAGSNVVSDDKEMLRSRVDHILCWI